MELNIDERLAARSEGERKPHKVTVRGKVFEAAPAPPWSVVKAAISGDAAEAFASPDALGRAVFGAEQWADLEAHCDAEEMMAIIEALPEMYGYGPGESSASTPPSKGTGQRSRRTSSGSTGSTSRKRSGAKKAG